MTIYVLSEAGKTKPIQTQFAQDPDGGLSFLWKQESSFPDNPGFRIKCGMTALDARFTEYDYAKQSQFSRRPGERKLLFDKELWQ